MPLPLIKLTLNLLDALLFLTAAVIRVSAHSLLRGRAVSATLALFAAVSAASAEAERAKPAVLSAGTFKHYVDGFNVQDAELYPQYIPNSRAWEFLCDNIPLFECPDPQLEEIYYFRWWTYRKHLKSTPDGFIVTEFLPAVSWAGKHNSISCPAGHHIYEGRWLHNPAFLDDYLTFWFRRGGEPRRYSFWAADAVWARYLVDADPSFATGLLDDLIRNYRSWEQERRQPDGLFWQIDDRDGMEVAIGGTGTRPTINAYMYGDAMAIARLAELAGRDQIAAHFYNDAARIRQLVDQKLWDQEAQFYKIVPRGQAQPADVRELLGYTPWYFHMPGPDKSIAWAQLVDPQGFHAPYGPTTAERRHPKFTISYEGHECQWNGPSWPYATSITLTALANLLNGVKQDIVDKKDYLELLRIYAGSHRLRRDDGTVVPWIDENLNPLTGDWVARTRLKSWRNGTWDPGKGGVERGKDYNHSTFCDLIISGLVGLRPRQDDTVEVNPLIPAETWDYFCLDQVRYHDRWLTILYDKTGTRYGRGPGLRILADGQEIARADSLCSVSATLPPLATANTTPGVASGWSKHEGNPVLGGELGTCFDVSLLCESGTYRMWFSWRPKRSLALVESQDGIHWSEPTIVLGPNPESDWESDINRPSVVRREDGYHLWYTGQARGQSWIGHATSPDGIRWSRTSPRPTLVPERPWEKVAVMCPHVVWDGKRRLYRMWYSAGEQYEPNVIGYATSPDGIVWTKHPENPIFAADPASSWERHKVTACQVIPTDAGHIMFYIGFHDEHRAQIGLACSQDGVTDWQRHPANPVLFPVEEAWDGEACYKPFALYDVAAGRWMLWYNGRRGRMEQIGLAVHNGYDLGFPAPTDRTAIADEKQP